MTEDDYTALVRVLSHLRPHSRLPQAVWQWQRTVEHLAVGFNLDKRKFENECRTMYGEPIRALPLKHRGK